MAIYNTLNWQNENALSSYPFTLDQEVQDFIVDAKFVQFDNFIPTLNYILVENDKIIFSITFDYGANDNIVFLKSTYDAGDAGRYVRMYNNSGDRHMGSLTIGPGAGVLWSSYVGRKIIYDIKFLQDTVRSIPLKDAVYLFDGSYGDVLLGRTDVDETIFYNTSTELNSITFNAVGGHAVKPGIAEGLRQINLVKPVNNNINLVSNDVIKITSPTGSYLTIDLVAGGTSAFTLPTLAS
jgi:hypothetical protein